MRALERLAEGFAQGAALGISYLLFDWIFGIEIIINFGR